MNRTVDAHLSEYAHHEVHERMVAAPPERVWRAMLQVTAAELTITRPLMSLRALPARATGAGDHLAAAPGVPIVESFLRRGWGVLESRAPERFAAAAIGQPWHLFGGDLVPVIDPAGFAEFAPPGYVRMAMSFELEPAGDGSRLRTETRVQPTNASSARAFARYWLVIRAPSGAIRRDLLRAIARRAEQASP
jgi:hypothetical protein